MMRSKNKLKKILGSNRPWYLRLYDFYIDRAIISDLLLGGGLIGIYVAIISVKKSVFMIDISSLQDILNELISTSLSLGGFVLAALAIIASIQLTVTAKDQKDAKTGKEYFYNSVGYKNVIKIYSISCFVYLFLFLFFTIARGVSDSIEFEKLVYIIISGVMILASSFIRCVLILWGLIRIK